MLVKRVLRLVVQRPVLLRPQRASRALGGALAQQQQQLFARGITTPSLPNFSSSAAAEHVANLPDPSEAFDRIVHKSPHEDIEIPEHTIWEVAERQARVNGDKPAFVCGITHQSVTFRELFAGARRLAASFAREGVRKGDVVVLHSFNCIEYPVVVLALTGMGVVCSPASPLFVPNELAYQLTNSKAKFLVTHKQLENVAVEAASMAGLSNAVTFTMGTTEASETHDLKSINGMAAQTEHDFFYERVDPNQKLMLPFSSGTTGNPKGVGLSARNLLANALQVSHVEPEGDNFLGLVPFFHIYGMMLIHLSILQAKSIVILPRFLPDTFLNALSTYKIRTAHIAPPAVLFLAHHPLVEEFDLSSTEFVVSGGAPIGKQVESLVNKRLGLNVKQIYGMTELSPAVNYGEDHTRKPQGSAGRLVPNTELRVRCMSTDRDLPPNHEGELLYRGPQVMLGYENNHEANQNIFTEDGFLRTGDIGYIDDDGFVFVIDRAKELIKYKGHQVAPGELEDVLNNHPAIADSCCVRGRNEMGEEIPKAFVVLKHPDSPTRPTPQDIMDYVAENVAPFKKVREVQFIEAIPKNASGKMLRRQLQERENRLHQA
ncbi:putative 4-coumarate-CoA ligase [Phytophthora cinnamomi]|uniref:putative 4-coumarate-CoA ligase n=1 Tax=Phytophthora cinnamomi TaxID=4785 RepID=UPI00355A7905|nr:putative 4-coumarate-CoA ligase [Phytophthora cinnamomi]